MIDLQNLNRTSQFAAMPCENITISRFILYFAYNHSLSPVSEIFPAAFEYNGKKLYEYIQELEMIRFI